MRIRKNAKLSHLLFSSHASAPEALQSHVCHLNQSPWDVISFGPESHQFEGEDSFTGNGSFGDSIGAVESVASKMDSWPTIMEEEMIIEAPLKVFDFDDNEAKPAKVNGIGKTHYCQKNDGKGWQCKKKAKLGYNYCDHHLSLLRSYNNSNGGNIAPSSSKKSPALSGGASRRTRPGNSRAAAGKKNGSSNPYEFYYYSGFGPKWGRKRGERDGNTANRVEIKAVVENNSGSSARSSPPSSSTTASPIHNEQFVDFVDDDDDDENDVASGDSGKKRMRKPVKARSLKSLM